MKHYLLLGLALLLSACTEEGTIAYRTSYPPFEVRTEGTWSQSLWDKRREHLTHTVYYAGQQLRMPGVPAQEPGYPRFDWLRRLPGGALLLGRLTTDTLTVPGYEFYHLQGTTRRPRLYVLGRCDFTNPLAQQEPEPALEFTPDTLGVLLTYPNSIFRPAVPPRFFDLTAPAHYTELPPAPTRPDGEPLELHALRWSPDHRWLAGTYYLSVTSERGRVELQHLRTGRRTHLLLPIATDTTHSAAPFDQLYWRPVAGGGYALARRPTPRASRSPGASDPAPGGL